MQAYRTGPVRPAASLIPETEVINGQEDLPLQ
jgi:hypothetical protein